MKILNFLMVTSLFLVMFLGTAFAKSTVVIVRDHNVFNSDGTVNQPVLNNMLSVGIKTFYGVDHAQDGWKQAFGSEDRVAIKVNALNAYFAPLYADYKGITHPELAAAIAQGVMTAGVKPENIVIFDRKQLGIHNKKVVNVLKLGNYKDYVPAGVHVVAGGKYGPAVTLSNGAKLNFLNELYWATKIINAPVLKAHPAMGLTFALKNNFGSFKPAEMKAVNGATQYASAMPLHAHGGIPGFRALNSFGPIKNKTKLIIGDALRVQYRAHYYDPKGSWAYDAIIIGDDPVAVDRTAWNILAKKRKEEGVNYYISTPLDLWRLDNKAQKTKVTMTSHHMARGGVAGAYIHDCALGGLGTDEVNNINLKIVNLTAHAF